MRRAASSEGGRRRRSGFFVLVLVVSFFLVGMALAYRSVHVMSKNNDGVTSSLRAIAFINELKTELEAAESGQRGFLLTADEDYLQPYNQAVQKINRLQDSLVHASGALPLQVRRTERLAVAIDDKIRDMQEAIDLVHRGEGGAVTRGRMDRNMAQSHSIAAILDEMKAEESWLLNVNRSEAEKTRNYVLMTLVAANIVGLLLVLSIYIVVYRNASRMTRLYEEIEDANSELEHKVQERTQALQLYSEDLQRSNRELEEFAFVASHDLQEPLRKIRAFGDRLLNKYSDDLSERGMDYVNRMHLASERMSVLIDDLLSFSRITTRRKPFVPVELNDIARGVLDDLELAIEDAEAEVRIDPLPAIEADGSQIGQVFMNLISNSLKFRRKDVPPRITVSCETWVECEPPAEGRPWCTLRFEDNGIGFDEQYADRVFQLFQRLHGRDAYPGTGIGLALCRKIIERHGGSIDAHSKQDAGSTFVIKLPMTQPSFDNLVT